MGLCGHPPPGSNAAKPRRIDRRVMLKASAAFGAMSLIGASGSLARRATAQNAETLAGSWAPAGAAEGQIALAQAVAEPIVFQSDFPFYAVAPHWAGETAPGAFVELRLSDDGQTWTDPIVVDEAVEDAGQPDLAGKRYGRLIAANAATHVSYQTFDVDGNPTELPGLEFTYLDATPGPTIDDVYAAALTPSIAPPPIISRADWGANESYRYANNGNEKWPAEYQTVEHVIIHHTDTANFQDPLVAIRSIYYYHAITRGWGDIGYNYLVDFMGNVYEGRVGGENVVGGHAYQYAHGSSGIGTMGRFSAERETPEMLAGLIWITAWTGRNLDPLGSAPFHEKPNLPTICGHRDVNDSTCPGDVMYADLPTIRQSVAEILAGEVNPNPADPQFAAGDTVVTNSAGVNLRQGPGLEFPVIVRMSLGETLTIVDGPTTNDGYTWYEVRGSTRIGWTAADFLDRAGGTPPSPTGQFPVGSVVAVGTDQLNLRSAARIDASVVAVMPTGTQGTVQAGPEASGGYNWYQLQTSVGNGWSAGEFLVLADGNEPTPPPTTPPPTTPPPTGGRFQIGDAVVVATDLLNLRVGPGTSQAVSAQMPQGTALTIAKDPVSAEGYVWYGVTHPQLGAGWCADQFLAAAGGGNNDGPLAVGDTVQVIDGALNLRAAAGTQAAVVAVMPQGTQLSITGGGTAAGGYTWWQVSSTAFGSGWAAGAFLQRV